MGRSERSRADVARAAPLLALVVAAAAGLAGAACRDEVTPTALLLELALAPGTTTELDELRFDVRQGDAILFDDARVPTTGPLVPASPPELGTVRLELGDAHGPLTIAIEGFFQARTRARGDAAVDARRAALTHARVLLHPLSGPTDSANGGARDAGSGGESGRDAQQTARDAPLGADAPAPVGAPEPRDGAAWGGNGGGLPPAACRTDDECPGGSFCREGACERRRGGGAPCGADDVEPAGDHQCASGICESGRCCGEVCGRCQACTGPGGTCAARPLGEEDRREASACWGPTVCDGRGGCRKSLGERCGSTRECAHGFCSDGVCCEAACGGPCRSCGTGLCLPVMNAQDPTGGCNGSRTCDARGECLKVVGTACRSGYECASGFCVDSVCCDSSCDAPCRSCAGGTCSVRVFGADRRCPAGASCNDGVCR